MSGHVATVDGARDAFRRQIRSAAARYHLERLARASRPIAWTLAVALLSLLILALVTPLAAYAWQIALALLLLGLASCAVIYRTGFDRRRLFVRMDAHAKLPDSVLSAGDWENANGDDPWRARQRTETLRRLENTDWRKTWPVRWPRHLWLPLASSLLLVATRPAWPSSRKTPRFRPSV
jgi:hypothetical protein